MRFLINVFIVIHLLLIAAWLFPVTPPLLAIKGFFNRYIVFLGLDQNYSMFAPVVRKTNRHLIALVTFHDLSTVMWFYPRMERMGVLEAMQKERYRKFANDNIVVPYFRMFLPDFARYIARLHKCSDNQPELITLYLSETAIPLSKQAAREIAANKEEDAPSSCRLSNIFTYQVEPEDLETSTR